VSRQSLTPADQRSKATVPTQLVLSAQVQSFRDAAPEPQSTRRQRRAVRALKHGDLDGWSRDKRLRGDEDPRPKGLADGAFRKIRASINDAAGRASGCLFYQIPVYQALQLLKAGYTPHTAMGRRAVTYVYTVHVGARGKGYSVQMRGKNRSWLSLLFADPHNERFTREDSRPSVRTLSSMFTALDRPGTKTGHTPEGIDVVRRWQAPDHVASKEEWLPHAKRPTARYYLTPAPWDFDVVGAFEEVTRMLGDTLPETEPHESWPLTPEEADASLREHLAERDGAGTGPPALS